MSRLGQTNLLSTLRSRRPMRGNEVRLSRASSHVLKNLSQKAAGYRASPLRGRFQILTIEPVRTIDDPGVGPRDLLEAHGRNPIRRVLLGVFDLG